MHPFAAESECAINLPLTPAALRATRRPEGRHEPGSQRDSAPLSRYRAGLLPALLALLMGLWGIRRENSMWRDESVTYQVAHRSLSEIWHLLGNADAVHGLYYFFMHALFAVGATVL